MGDLYSELLVKKDKTAKDSLLKYGLIVLTVLAVFAGLIITPLALIIAVALGIACYFVIPKTDVEYEYLFINGDFDIDMIMSKTKRKKVKTLLTLKWNLSIKTLICMFFQLFTPVYPSLCETFAA